MSKKSVCVKKNGSLNLTKSLVVYKRNGGQSVDLISLVVSIRGRPQVSIAAIFRQSAGYVSPNGIVYAIFRSTDYLSDHLICRPQNWQLQEGTKLLSSSPRGLRLTSL